MYNCPYAKRLKITFLVLVRFINLFNSSNVPFQHKHTQFPNDQRTLKLTVSQSVTRCSNKSIHSVPYLSWRITSVHSPTHPPITIAWNFLKKRSERATELSSHTPDFILYLFHAHPTKIINKISIIIINNVALNQTNRNTRYAPSLDSK